MQSLVDMGRKLFGVGSDKTLQSLRPLLARINELEAGFQFLPDEGLRQKTAVLRNRAQGGEDLDRLLPEAFANCREALRRFLDLRAFDVQLMGGIVLHQGKIAEMATGEGKTLVAVFAAYLNALAGKGVHVVTVNDYLAKRDIEWMGKAYAALGVTASLVHPGQIPPRRRAAYRADITYSTFSEMGFDYLNDNMRSSLADMVQRGHACAIIDEADSVLIDEARTPLIISGPSQDRSELHVAANEIVSRFQPQHFDLDKGQPAIMLTEAGNDFVERELAAAGLLREGRGLYDSESQAQMLHVMQALRAHKIYHRDRDYIVRGQDVILINSATGRMMPKRRLSDGQHQAIEAKEGVAIKAEAVTLASITVQNYFRLYARLAGMTGTAATDSEELKAVYNVDVVPLPTNNPVRRHDQLDEIYRAEGEKHLAIMAAIRDAARRGQPVLVGTTSIEKSEQLSRMLQSEGIEHSLLNAHHHEIESQIISDAGKPGAVTIATNMAGRGTDIQLGGNARNKLEQALAAEHGLPPGEIRSRVEVEHAQARAAVVAAGGLFVLGTERHESRRIDNQLRGRSGRQGDPGRTLFILSLEDELLKNADAAWLGNVVSKSKPQESWAANQPHFKKAMDGAQSRSEMRNFRIRKQLLRFDNVINEQRKIIYAQRLSVMQSLDVSDMIGDMLDQFLADLIELHLPVGANAEHWDVESLETACRNLLALDLPINSWAKEPSVDPAVIHSRILGAANSVRANKTEMLGPELMCGLEKQILLQAIDAMWRDHRVSLEHLRAVVGLRSYAKRDPHLEFQTEAFDLFEKLLVALRREVSCGLAQVQPVTDEEQMAMMGSLSTRNRSEADTADINPQVKK